MVDETRVSRVSTKVDGWVENVDRRLHGLAGSQGPTALYPLQPRTPGHAAGVPAGPASSKDIMQKQPAAAAQQQSDSLIAAARRRLELWDLTDAADRRDRAHRQADPQRDDLLAGQRPHHRAQGLSQAAVTPEMELYTHRRPLAACGSWPTSSSTTLRGSSPARPRHRHLDERSGAAHSAPGWTTSCRRWIRRPAR